MSVFNNDVKYVYEVQKSVGRYSALLGSYERVQLFTKQEYASDFITLEIAKVKANVVNQFGDIQGAMLRVVYSAGTSDTHNTNEFYAYQVVALPIDIGVNPVVEQAPEPTPLWYIRNILIRFEEQNGAGLVLKEVASNQLRKALAEMGSAGLVYAHEGKLYLTAEGESEACKAIDQMRNVINFAF